MVLTGTSCLDKNFDDISLDESGPWEPVVALPIGKGSLDVNSFFSGYTLPDSISGDTLRVFFDDEDYILADQQIEADYSFDYSLYHYLDSPDLIRYATIFLRVENYYPAACQVQIYVEDAPGQPLDSVFDLPPMAEPAETGEDGRVTEPANQLFSADLDSTNVETLFQGSRVRAAGSLLLRGEPGEIISIYSGQYIHLTVFMKVALRFREDDLEN
jgi:hypothetical protein